MQIKTKWNGIVFELSGDFITGGPKKVSDDPYYFDVDFPDEVSAFGIKHNNTEITNIVDDYVYNSLYELFIQEARSAL
jgi:hypothetical protein